MDRLHTAGMAAGRVALWLEHAVARLEVWKASAARSGAQMALRFVTSWYPGVDLGLLAMMREVPEAERVAHEGALVRRANELASYVDPDELLPALCEDGEPVAEDSFGIPQGPGDEEVVDESTASSTGSDTEATETVEEDPKAAASPGQSAEPAGGTPED